MLKSFLIMLSTLVSVLFALHKTHYDPGSVTILIDTIHVQTTLWFFCLSLLIMVVIALSLGRLLGWLGLLKRREKQLVALLNEALNTGHWSSALKRIKKTHDQWAGLGFVYNTMHYLLDTRQPMLRSKNTPHIAQILEHLCRQAYDQAHQCLVQSSKKIPPYVGAALWLRVLDNHPSPSAQALWCFYQTKRKQWRMLLKCQAHAMERLCLQLLSQPPSDKKLLWSLWQQLPHTLCHRPDFTLAMSQALITLGDTSQAQSLLLGQWQKHWDASVMVLYLQTLPNDQARCNWLNPWRKKAPASIQPHLLASLGQLALKQGDFEVARLQLEQAVHHPSAPQPLPMIWQLSLALALTHLKKTAPLETMLNALINTASKSK